MLLQLALDGAQFHPTPQAPAIQGSALENLAAHYRTAMRSINRLGKRYPLYILKRLLNFPPLTVADLSEEEKVIAWTQRLEEQLNEPKTENSLRYQTAIKKERRTGVVFTYGYDY